MEPKFNSGGLTVILSLVILNFISKFTGKTCSLIDILKGTTKNPS